MRIPRPVQFLILQRLFSLFRKAAKSIVSKPSISRMLAYFAVGLIVFFILSRTGCLGPIMETVFEQEVALLEGVLKAEKKIIDHVIEEEKRILKEALHDQKGVITGVLKTEGMKELADIVDSPLSRSTEAFVEEVVLEEALKEEGLVERLVFDEILHLGEDALEEDEPDEAQASVNVAP